MPAPSVATYSAESKVTVHTAFLNLLDTGSYALLRGRDAADVLLFEIQLSDPAGTVNGTTGQLTITATGPDTSANASGTCAYCELTESDGTVHLALPTQAGTAAVSGKAVLNTLAIISGTPVTAITITIG
jgi:hypothetical protein